MNRRPFTATALSLVAICGSYGALVSGATASAQTPHNCGGQHAAVQPVPYTCVNARTIDGTLFTAVSHADGTHVTVVITLDAPRAVDTLARIIHHEGKSGMGGVENTSSGTIPAGATSITLVDSAPCRLGQLDIKAVFTGNGDSRGRIGGPWISNGTDCSTTSTTSPPPATSIVQRPPTSTSTPGVGTPPVSSSTVPVSPVPHGLTGSALPATGIELTLVPLALALVALGRGLRRIAHRTA